MKDFNQLLQQNTFEDQLLIAGNLFYVNRVRDCELLLDAITEREFGIDERIPYWAELWPSAVALSEYILANQSEFKSKYVLELGCGLGLCGMAAHRAGARIVFSDYDNHALEYTRLNFKRNFKHAAVVKKVDWRNPVTSEKFDIIIAADILYETRWLQPVFETLNKLLPADGVAIIAEPDRTIAKGFFNIIRSAGWPIEKVRKKVNLDNKISEISVYRIKKC